MRDYELVIIVKPALKTEEVDGILDKFKKLVQKGKGKVGKIDEWGKRKLAYPIDDYSEGNYFLIDFSADKKVLTEIDRVLPITDEVIRYMIVRAEESA